MATEAHIRAHRSTPGDHPACARRKAKPLEVPLSTCVKQDAHDKSPWTRGEPAFLRGNRGWNRSIPTFVVGVKQSQLGAPGRWKCTHRAKQSQSWAGWGIWGDGHREHIMRNKANWHRGELETKCLSHKGLDQQGRTVRR